MKIKKFSQALCLKSLDLFSESARGVRLFHDLYMDGETGDICNLNLQVKLRALLRQIPINLAISAIAEAILLRISAE